MPFLRPQSLQDSNEAPANRHRARLPGLGSPSPEKPLLPAQHHAQLPSSFHSTGRSTPLGRAHRHHPILEYSGILKLMPKVHVAQGPGGLGFVCPPPCHQPSAARACWGSRQLARCAQRAACLLPGEDMTGQTRPRAWPCPGEPVWREIRLPSHQASI